MLSIVAVDEVLHYAAAFEHADFFAIWEDVCDGGDPGIRVDCFEPGCLLLVCRDVDLAYGVREAQFFKGNTDLNTVSRWSVVWDFGADLRGFNTIP